MPRGLPLFMTSKLFTSLAFADVRRGSRHERGYGAEWVRIRERIMVRDCGLCQPCMRARRVTAAHAVDHIVPKSQGGGDDDNNLQAICNPCHSEKTAGEALAARGLERRPDAACGIDGMPVDPSHPWALAGQGGVEKSTADRQRTDRLPSLATRHNLPGGASG